MTVTSLHAAVCTTVIPALQYTGKGAWLQHSRQGWFDGNVDIQANSVPSMDGVPVNAFIRLKRDLKLKQLILSTREVDRCSLVQLQLRDIYKHRNQP